MLALHSPNELLHYIRTIFRQAGGLHCCIPEVRHRDRNAV